jgi:hypothetical protein
MSTKSSLIPLHSLARWKCQYSILSVPANHVENHLEDKPLGVEVRHIFKRSQRLHQCYSPRVDALSGAKSKLRYLVPSRLIEREHSRAICVRRRPYLVRPVLKRQPIHRQDRVLSRIRRIGSAAVREYFGTGVG